MIPKKLDKLASTEELIVWLNELRDFLQAKEEASKPHKKNCKFMASAGYEACDCKEASNGECPHCDEKHMDGYAHNPKTCFMCRDNPPEHEDEWEKEFDNKFPAMEWFDIPNDLSPQEASLEVKAHIRDNFVSKEKIKNLATQMGMRSSAKIVQLKTLNRLQIEDIIYDKILESLGLGD